MGVVSSAVLEHGGKVTGIVPHAMVISGGEGSKVDDDGEEKKGVESEKEEGKAVSHGFLPLVGWGLENLNVRLNMFCPGRNGW
jgi:hypothetical protein